MEIPGKPPKKRLVEVLNHRHIGGKYLETSNQPPHIFLGLGGKYLN